MRNYGWIILTTMTFICCKESRVLHYYPEHEESYTVRYLVDSIILTHQTGSDCFSDTLIWRGDGYYVDAHDPDFPGREELLLGLKDTTFLTESSGGNIKSSIKKIEDAGLYESEHRLCIDKKGIHYVTYRYDDKFHIKEIEASTSAIFHPE